MTLFPGAVPENPKLGADGEPEQINPSVQKRVLTRVVPVNRRPRQKEGGILEVTSSYYVFTGLLLGPYSTVIYLFRYCTYGRLLVILVYSYFTYIFVCLK